MGREVLPDIDRYTGEVNGQHIVIDNIVRASDYAEWEQKRTTSVRLTEQEKRIWKRASEIGNRLGAPRWLINEVFWFIKMMYKLKEKLGTGISIGKDKFMYAVFAVVAEKKGFIEFTDRINRMDCGDGIPCMLTRRKGDKAYRRYKKRIEEYASHIYKAVKRNPRDVILLYATRFYLPSEVVALAIDLATRNKHMFSGRKSSTMAAASILAAVKILGYDTSVLKTAKYMVNGAVEELAEELIKSSGLIADKTESGGV